MEDAVPLREFVRNELMSESSIERASSERNSNSDLSCHAKVHSNSACSPNLEHVPFSSRCSVRLIHEIISKFSAQKIQLVRSIGFGGILHIPVLKQINLKFTTWLMIRVDQLTQTLLLADGSRLPFSKEDVGIVFGIPCSGRSILSNPDSLKGDPTGLNFQPGDADAIQFKSIKAAQAILCRQHYGEMSPMEQDEFRAAFVVFVMSTLLAPCAKHDRVSDDFIHAVQKPSCIKSFDWAEYVLRRLLDAVAKLKADIANNVKAPYIYGCSLFLQVLYLDSIDLGMLSMSHDDLPRIKLFTADRIRSMIAADSSFSFNCNEMSQARRPKLRKSHGVCYSWARTAAEVDQCGMKESWLMELWDLSVTMTRVFKIPLEAAGPLFIAASDYQRQVNRIVGADSLKFMNVLIHIIEPYMNGFSYKPSVRLNDRPIDLCYLGHRANCKELECCYHFAANRAKRKATMINGECSSTVECGGSITKHPWGTHVGAPSFGCMETLPGMGNGSVFRNEQAAALLAGQTIEDVDIRVINAMARFYLFISPVKATRCSDLNAMPQCDATGIGLENGYSQRLFQATRSPWELGFNCNIDVQKASHIMRKLQLVEDIDEPFIVHFCPKYIEVITRAVKEQFVGHTEFEMEMFDAVLRRFKQTDDELYLREGPLRFRHYVEADFMMSLLAGCFDPDDSVIKAHFSGRHIKYDIRSCHIIFFPFILQYRWVCFAWRLDDNTILVYDPCFSTTSQNDVSYSYGRVVKLLKQAMCLISSLVMGGWPYRWQDATVEMFNVGSAVTTRPNRTGLRCLHFCRCFDGKNLNPPLDEAQIDVWGATVLAEVSMLDGNLGLAPNYIP